MIIGISGKSQSSKDTIGNIIQYLTSDLYKVDNFTYEQFINRLGKYYNANHLHDWKIKKFGDKLKDIVCLLIGCTREQLEDEEFKDTELGEEWWYWKVFSDIIKDKFEMIPYNSEKGFYDRRPDYKGHFLVKLTPKDLLQLLGTDFGRDFIHPDIWVNSLMREYRKSIINPNHVGRGATYEGDSRLFPKWVITDSLYLNELKAIKDKGGITIRVGRDFTMAEGIRVESMYDETLLEDYKEWDYTIDNDGAVEELIEKVKEILIDLEIIQ